MRWSIIRLIWFRELRDQLRDRRTIFMIVVLPVILYPILGILGLQFALAGAGEKSTTIGIQGIEYLPAWGANSAGFSILPVVACFTMTPAELVPPAAGGARMAAMAWLVRASELEQSDPPLVVGSAGHGWRFPLGYFDDPALARNIHVKGIENGQSHAQLEAKEVDLALIVAPDFQEQLDRGNRPVIAIESRDGDETSHLASKRIYEILARWKQLLKEVRLRRHGLPANFDDPIAIQDPEMARPALELATRALREQMIRIFPFMLVMWSLAGALYPAIDVCAGEKERGTMETLLISPASREEIVWGKFLTIWLFSTLTTLWNLASMGATALIFSSLLPQQILAPAAVFWCVVSVLPLTAFFSAVCLAMGVYARSSKEGQYYLMPLFLATMPLIMLTLAPGVHLNAFYSLVPVTGVALLMQRLMVDSSFGQVPWLYFVPVLAAIVLYSSLALRWAIEQFKREEVLFREAERLDVGLWLRRLFREKEARTSVGQALFCFGTLLALRWLFFGSSSERSATPMRALIAYLTLLGPPLFMALLLTTRPRGCLGWRWPPPQAMIHAVLLAALLSPPLLVATEVVRQQMPRLTELSNGQRPPSAGPEGEKAASAPEEGLFDCWWSSILVLGLLRALGEELAFRGLILNGLRGRFLPRGAILLSSFLYALYGMNAFWFVPAFAAGVVLGLLTVRSASIVPAILLHFLGRLLPATAHHWPSALQEITSRDATVCWMATVLCIGLAGVLLWQMDRQAAAFIERRAPPEED